MKNVMMVGSAERSNGGVSTVLKLLKTSFLWNKYNCYWLGTQIQGNKFIKLFYAIKAYIVVFFIIWKYKIIHFHTVPDISLIVQLPVFLLAILWRKKIILHLHVGNQIKDFKDSKLFHFCIKKSDKVLLLSQSWTSQFKQLFPSLNVSVDFLYNPCLSVESLDYSMHKNTIIFAAHLNSNKAYDVLLKGFEIINKKYPEWGLIIMGDGEVDKAKKLAVDLDISQRVTFTGYIEGKEKEKIFKEAGIYCMCSYKEGFPMVVLEAWSYGVPVITTPVGGLPEVLEEQKNSLAFNFGNYIELSQKLDFLISNYQLRTEMSSYSKEYVTKNFSLNIISEKLDSIYKSI